MGKMAQKQAAIVREVRDAAAWILCAFVPRTKAQEILVVGEGFEAVSLHGRHSTALDSERRTARLRQTVDVPGIPRHKVALRGDVPADELRDAGRQPEPEQVVGPDFFVLHDAD